jgi:hypothetical protein
MPYIYCITNHENGKKYVGKTTTSVSKRWKEHCRDYKKSRCEDRPLYRAMIKYGVDSFSVEELEECDAKECSNREVYWVEKLNTYKHGYNATVGGDGSILYDYEEIRKAYKSGLTMKETAEVIGCCVDIVSRAVKDIKREPRISGSCKSSVKVLQYKEDEYIQTFNSIADAAHWCVDNGLAKTYNGGVRSHIADVAKHKTKRAYGYRWEYEQ